MPGARVDELSEWMVRRFSALRRHAEAPMDLVDELPDDLLADPEESRRIIDRYRSSGAATTPR